MYDAIIVGARCAGSPTAALLARKGHNVLVVDRARFPSDTLSTHFIQQPGVAYLSRWGVLDDVLSTKPPLITTASFGGEEGTTGVDVPEVPGVPGIVAPRRTILDKILVDAADRAGAEIGEGFTFEDVVWDEDRVAGIKGRSSTGEQVVEKARIVVGADGRNSTVAEAVGAQKDPDIPPLNCGYYSYWSGFESRGAEVYFLENNVFISFPTNDGLSVLIALWPPERFSEIRRDARNNYVNALRSFSVIGERLDAATQEERLYGSQDIPNFMRTAAGPGWALVGDAAYHKDPTPADGISDAFTGVDLLVQTLDRHLADGDDDTLNDYARQLQETSMPHFKLCLEVSSFKNAPAERSLKFAEHQVDRFMQATEIVTQTEAMATS